MTREEAEKYADNMTYRDAINNLMKARSIPYRKATFIKVNELLKVLEPSGDIEEIKEVIGCDADAETKCKMISNILTAKPHYFEKQEPKYCNRNICIQNEYNGIGCDECEVTKEEERE